VFIDPDSGRHSFSFEGYFQMAGIPFGKLSMKRFVFLPLFSFLISGCDDVSGSRGMADIATNRPIEINMHEDIEGLVARSPVIFSEGCMSAVNMCWYKVERSFGDSKLPAVIIDKSMTLDHVARISIAVDSDVGRSVEDLDLSIRSLPDNSLHDDYRLFLFELIDKITAAGWQHYYSPSDPRVSGSQMDKIDTPDYVLGDYVLSHPWLDPSYRLDLRRWLRIGRFHTWTFFKDGNYLKVQAWSRDSDDAPEERGTYLVSLNFKTQSEYWRTTFYTDKENARWTELMPERLEKYRIIREAREQKAIEAGIEIDTSYHDPVIQALK
jgi:hypothetical protein